MTDYLPTEIRLAWPTRPGMPQTVLVIKHNRVLTAAELRTLANIVGRVEAMRAYVEAGES
jgi:hypothetical protein